MHRGAVALVPMVDREHVCLIENHRYAVGKTLIEVPAGTIDRGESPDATAVRELGEETGYRAAVGSSGSPSGFVSPGVLSERMVVYLCTDLLHGSDRPSARRAPHARGRVVVRGAGDGRRRPDRGRQDDARAVALRPASKRLTGEIGFVLSGKLGSFCLIRGTGSRATGFWLRNPCASDGRGAAWSRPPGRRARFHLRTIDPGVAGATVSRSGTCRKRHPGQVPLRQTVAPATRRIGLVGLPPEDQQQQQRWRQRQPRQRRRRQAPPPPPPLPPPG